MQLQSTMIVNDLIHINITHDLTDQIRESDYKY